MQSDIDAQLTNFFEDTQPREFAKVMRGYDPQHVTTFRAISAAFRGPVPARAGRTRARPSARFGQAAGTVSHGERSAVRCPFRLDQLGEHAAQIGRVQEGDRGAQ